MKDLEQGINTVQIDAFVLASHLLGYPSEKCSCLLYCLTDQTLSRNPFACSEAWQVVRKYLNVPKDKDSG